MPLHDAPAPIGHRYFEDVFCQIHRHSRRVHHLDSFWLGFGCHHNFSLAHRCRTAIQEESISTLGAAVMFSELRAMSALRHVAFMARRQVFWSAAQAHR